VEPRPRVWKPRSTPVKKFDQTLQVFTPARRARRLV
jgi:hypothetical protein